MTDELFCERAKKLVFQTVQAHVRLCGLVWCFVLWPIKNVQTVPSSQAADPQARLWPWGLEM